MINYNDKIYLIKKHNPYFKTILKQNIFNYIHYILNSTINIKYNHLFHKHMFNLNNTINYYKFLEAQAEVLLYFKDMISNKTIFNKYLSKFKFLNLKIKENANISQTRKYSI